MKLLFLWHGMNSSDFDGADSFRGPMGGVGSENRDFIGHWNGNEQWICLHKPKRHIKTDTLVILCTVHGFRLYSVFCISVLDVVNLFTCEEMSGWLVFLGHGKGNIRLGHPRTIRGISRKKIFYFTVMMLVGSCEDPNRKEIITVRGQSNVWCFPKYWPPTPSPPGECVPLRLWCGGRTHLLVGEGGGGSIFWKTPDTALYSTYST